MMKVGYATICSARMSKVELPQINAYLNKQAPNSLPHCTIVWHNKTYAAFSGPLGVRNSVERRGVFVPCSWGGINQQAVASVLANNLCDNAEIGSPPVPYFFPQPLMTVVQPECLSTTCTPFSIFSISSWHLLPMVTSILKTATPLRQSPRHPCSLRATCKSKVVLTFLIGHQRTTNG
jgi:hypothetical protein